MNRKLLETNSKINPKYIPTALARLGYIPHPNLANGRATRIIKMDGGQSKLYVTKDHPSLKITNAPDISDCYEKDQAH